MSYEFKTALTRSGNIVNPDRITVTDESVTWEKRNSYLLGKDSTTIPIDKIVSVEINNKGFGTDVTINSYGNGTIHAKNFTISDAKEMKRIIEGYMRDAKDVGTSSRSDFVDEPVFTRPLSTSDEEAIMYVRYDKVPLIKFGNSTEKIIEELDRIATYAKSELLNTNTTILLVDAYVSKLEEGLRKLDRLGVKKQSIENDIKRFENLILQLQEKIKVEKPRSLKGEKLGFKWVGVFVMIYWKWILGIFLLYWVFGR